MQTLLLALPSLREGWRERWIGRVHISSRSGGVDRPTVCCTRSFRSLGFAIRARFWRLTLLCAGCLVNGKLDKVTLVYKNLVLSCLVLSCHVLSCLVMSCLVLSCSFKNAVVMCGVIGSRTDPFAIFYEYMKGRQLLLTSYCRIQRSCMQ
ncbi:hypothetical protein BCR34DRAFT_191434 [Clohesyomyces aquaticus]|uniref:Uncharacterized protein n=1 Tax=Clohesyomyces aquaticus TaxID=1231657 RepID=A0A1Y1ZY93_9PLEO|nr:hypothetical protein BCR34DRAFT_191434 [Clohesyomyces aquaticus]